MKSRSSLLPTILYWIAWNICQTIVQRTYTILILTRYIWEFWFSKVLPMLLLLYYFEYSCISLQTSRSHYILVHARNVITHWVWYSVLCSCFNLNFSDDSQGSVDVHGLNGRLVIFGKCWRVVYLYLSYFLNSSDNRTYIV